MHHLFPSIHPCHYPVLRHKLIPVCEKYGINYEQRSSGDFFEALARYFGWISILNETKDVDVDDTKQDGSFWDIFTASEDNEIDGFVSASSR